MTTLAQPRTTGPGVAGMCALDPFSDSIYKGDGYAGPGKLVTMFSSKSSQSQMETLLELPHGKVLQAGELAQQFRSRLDQQNNLAPSDTNSRKGLRDDYNQRIEHLFSTAEVGRLRQVSRLQKGPAALLDTDVADRLQLSRTQRNEISSLDHHIDAEERDAINELPRVTADYVAGLRAQFRKKKEEAMTAVLNLQQRDQWSLMKSEDAKAVGGR